MNNLWKKIGLGAVIIGIIAFAVFYFNDGKGGKTFNSTVNPAFGEYITSYTAGVIGSGSPIRMVLSSDMVDSASVGDETTVKLFELSPSVKGVTVWLDRRTVEFRPEARLISGQIYEIRFQLSRLIEVPEALRTFEYTLQVIPQNFEVSVENIKPYVKTDLKRQKIEGTLFTADFADNEAIEKMLAVQQDGKALKVNWSHMAEGKEHLFTIEDVSRKETASIVKLGFSGASLGVDQNDDREVEIAALGDFKVTNVRVEQGTSQQVVIQFSDPLNESQNLEGLINISELSSLDFEIKDNEIRVYPAVRQTGSRTLNVEAGIKNILDYRMPQATTFDIAFEQTLPAVRFTGKGNVLPSSEGLVLPFEAVNLKAVDVKIIKIYESNVLQFLQANDYDGNQELRRVGKPVFDKMISLENAGVTDFGKWNRFTLDLSKFINAEPGAIYQVQVNFKKSYLAYVCEGAEADELNTQTGFEEGTYEEEVEGSYWDSYDDDYYYDDYDWQQRDNPCHSSYYTGNRKIRKNILASDLGLLAKRGGDGNTMVVVNDLKTTQPLSGVQLELYDFQQQLIGSASTGADGKAIISTKQRPFALIAKSGSQRGYLKVQDGESLSLSNFNVGGEFVNKGLKGFLYGERGVWRPGDSLYLSFILEDKLKLLPPSHPVVFELQNPQGQITSRLVRSNSENGFYKFATATSSDAPTGNWMGHVKVGGTEFTQPIKIEMVKPNRLKINLDFGVDKLTASDNKISGDLKVNWLHGAPGKNLRAQFEVLLTKGTTKFDQYSEYVFDDPSLDFYSESKPIYDGYTDSDGNARINVDIPVSEQAPGTLNAIFRGKVYEESGNFSIDRFSIPYYPYRSLTGIRLPQGDKTRGMLLTDTTHRVDIVTVDADGKPLSRSVELSIYKINWRWWWDGSEGAINFMSGNYSQPVSVGKIQTLNGKGTWNFKIKYPEWGRFFVKAYDPQSGHSTGKVVYIDWPGWAGRARNESEGATMLSFSSDKPMYNIGEKASLVIPGGDKGRALISIENGSRVLQTYWLQTQKGDNQFSFDVTKEMTPNVFINVTLLQPHAQTTNDLPIRMYGIIPIQVEDPGTHLNPLIAMPDVLEPGKEVVIKISEKSRRKMTYTIAIVDEGLLDLTRFKTPDAWSRFYAREALGVKTWDLYDQAMGSFGGRLDRLLALGGDSELAAKEDDAKANRFKPVVKFFGPFTQDGGSNEHKFIMPQYIGSVKTMLVAGYEGAYGKAEKVTPVRKPLMVLATLPRVLGPEEAVKLPITLFAGEKNISNVKVDIKVTGPVGITESSRMVSMSGNTDMTFDFDLLVKGETGKAMIKVTATSGNYQATDEIEIEVRNSNPPITKVQDGLLESGKTWTSVVAPVGVKGTNSSILEISSLPPINLGQRLKYLYQYPYGCIEQTTSAVFPQLYLDKVKSLTEDEKAVIQRNVKAGVERLKTFINRDGGFSYWPGDEDSDSWGTTYAGHFLIEAEDKGYYVPNDMIKRWKKYQKSKAQSWRKNQETSSSELIQAYRLYVLSLSGDPELGAMNRLREQVPLPATAAWMLAAAYIKTGQPEAGKKLIDNLSTNVKPYQEMAYSYGSDIRDKAIILETLLLLNDRVRGFELVKEISQSLSNANYWMSTQSLAWSLKSVGAFAAAEQKGELKFTYSYNGKEVTASTDLSIAQVALPVEGVKNGNVKVTSASKGVLFVRLISEGVPARGQEEDDSKNLSLTVSYTDAKGNAIIPDRLEQGTEFVATVTVFNPGIRGIYKNLALNQIFPSGWEINNLRLTGDEGAGLTGDVPTYQDIRDDRVYTYFDLSANQRKTFKVLLTASYAGSYYLPAVSCEAMYDNSVYARKKGKSVEVVKKSIQ
jgi:alpha-2-macroglobulin